MQLGSRRTDWLNVSDAGKERPESKGVAEVFEIGRNGLVRRGQGW